MNTAEVSWSPKTLSFEPAGTLREIPFQVVSPSQQALCDVPFSCGLCVPKGRLFKQSDWVVEGLGGAPLAAGTKVLNRWSDGSIRWLLVSFVAGNVSPGRTSCLLVRPGHRPRQTATVVTCRKASEGGLQLSVQNRSSRLPTDVRINMLPELCNTNGQPLRLRVTDIHTDDSDDARCLITVEMVPRGLKFLSMTFRVEVWLNSGLIGVRTRLRNTRRAKHQGGVWDLGDPGSFHFSSFRLALKPEGLSEAAIVWKAEQSADIRTCSPQTDLRIQQSGSGGSRWGSSNHVDAAGIMNISDRGYSATSSAGTLRGYRAEPTVSVVSDDHALTVAVPEFWQQFPTAITATGNEIGVEFFPADVSGPFELQGGEQKTSQAWLSTRPMAPNLTQLAWVYETPRALQSAESYRKSDAFTWFPGSLTSEGSVSTHSHASEVTRRFLSYLNEATSGQHSIRARREKIDEYGWRNYGDVPADHEQTHYAGSNTIISHYNNQFDLIYGGLLNLAATGHLKWLDLADPLSRHVMDIDIYHTQEDRPCFNGGLFWHTDHYVDAKTATHRTYSKHNAKDGHAYGGGPANEHNYTTGLLYYYFLTGSPEAYDSVLSLADWVINMDDGRRTIWGLFDSGATGLASKTVWDDYHGPGRGAGNSINALLDAWILTRKRSYLDKAEQLIRRVVHPQQSCDDLHLIDAEGHWSYTVCMTAIGRYLDQKLEADELDEMYSYARETLLNYGRWMARHERPTLNEPEKLEYPTEAWAAQDLRKANVIRLAASCTNDATEEVCLRRRADLISDAAWKQLYGFGHQHLTARCLSIIMTEGQREVFHRCCRPGYMPPGRVRYRDSKWKMFVPQNKRVRDALRSPLKVLRVLPGVINPLRIFRTVDALRRHL